ncbi:hypothetical protein [Pontibacter liquoris]|uniref:hypothetical protein n=1 Tax=Pontibacter liquoris TaxID=2905677 RepID=UPI001FA7F949|nr:hypothetical protein [Pontibacter liquoris]
MANVCYLLWMLLLLVAGPLWAQAPRQPVRLELPFNVEDTYVEVIPLPDSSLLVYHKTGDSWGTDATFGFTRYDQQLEEIWTSDAPLKPDQNFIRSFTEAPYTYLLFGGINPQEYTIVRVNLATGKASVKDYTLAMLEAIYEFGVLQNRYFLIGKSKNDTRPLLIYLNPDNGELKPLPAIYGDESTFSDLLVDAAHQRVDIIISESNGRVARLQVKSFNPAGELIVNQFILPRQDRSLLNAEVSPGDSITKLLIGTYGARDVRFTQGFFTMPAMAEERAPNFYSVLQLRNFLKFMKPRREERTRRREAERLKAGKEPGYRYRMLLHDLIPTPNGYVLAAEVYYPQFRDNASDAFNRTISFAKGPEGYKHTHVVAMGFDKEGVLLWDNSFPIGDIITPTLTHTVEIGANPADGRVIVAYPDNEKIVYRVMQDDTYTDEETTLKILPYNKTDKVEDTSEEGIKYWYGSNFAAFGFQRINGAGKVRNVFYVNKISF